MRNLEDVLRDLENFYDGKVIVNPCNRVYICGVIDSNLEYYYDNLYKIKIKTERFSQKTDNINIVFPYNNIQDYLDEVLKGKKIEIGGEFHSHNVLGSDGKKHLQLYVFSKKFKIYESTYEELNVKRNLIYLEGYVTQKPVFRRTPSGLYLTELFIAVNTDKKSHYIPCIAWNDYAEFSRFFETGERIALYGRIQSRVYYKEALAKYFEVTEVSITEFV